MFREKQNCLKEKVARWKKKLSKLQKCDRVATLMKTFQRYNDSSEENSQIWFILSPLPHKNSFNSSLSPRTLTRPSFFYHSCPSLLTSWLLQLFNFYTIYWDFCCLQLYFVTQPKTQFRRHLCCGFVIYLLCTQKVFFFVSNLIPTVWRVEAHPFPSFVMIFRCVWLSSLSLW